MLKKLLILLFLLCLVPLAATLAEQMPESYFSDFSADEDGWYAQENASIARTKSKTLLVKTDDNKKTDICRDFDLVKGVAYQITMEVRQKNAKWGRFFSKEPTRRTEKRETTNAAPMIMSAAAAGPAKRC